MCLNRALATTCPEVRERRIKSESYLKLKAAARKLFIERGYHATRPQDIAREAALGNGTFYRYFPDKRACFLTFVEDARTELDAHLRYHAQESSSLKNIVETMFNAILEYSEIHPGVLTAAMVGDAMIDTEGPRGMPSLQRWGQEWARIIRSAIEAGVVFSDVDPDIIGQAIAGALHQAASEGISNRRNRQEMVECLTRFFVRALRPPKRTAKHSETGTSARVTSV